MKELSLYLLDISQNSLSAGAEHLDITLVMDGAGVLTITVADDGCGMSPAFLQRVTDPFTTTRTTRKVGMGIPLLRLAAQQTDGTFAIESTEGVGTTVTVTFHTHHIDCPPMGDLADTLALLMQGAPLVALTFTHRTPGGEIYFSTQDLMEELGGDLPLDAPEVFLWLRDYLTQLERDLTRPQSESNEE